MQRFIDRINAHIFKFIVLLCLSSATMTATAVELSDLYEARVSVNTQSQAERERALQEAFSQVILKVTGNRNLLQEGDVKNAKQQVNNYLVQYSYRQDNNQLQLWASFDQSKVEALIRRLDGAIWGNRRPKLMLWLAIEENGVQRTILSSDDESVFAQQLQNKARERGLPLALPLMDLKDSMAVSVSDIWGRFNAPLRDAAERYSADGIISAKLFRSKNADGDDEWVIDWDASIANERANGRATSADKAMVAEPMMDDLANQLAQLYGIRDSDQTADELTIRVVELKKMHDVLAVEAFLSSLSVIKSVQLQSFGNGNAEFHLMLHGDIKRAQQTIALDRRIQRINDSPFAFDVSIPEYQWQSR